MELTTKEKARIIAKTIEKGNDYLFVASTGIAAAEGKAYDLFGHAAYALAKQGITEAALIHAVKIGVSRAKEE